MISGAAMKTTNPSEMRYCCPKCGDDKFHLYYNIRKEVYHCFKCGSRGKHIPSRSYTDTQLEEMIRILKGEVKPNEGYHNLTLPESYPIGDDINSRYAISYLSNRGLTMDKIRDLGLMLSDEALYKFRIIFPIYGTKMRVVYYQSRAFISSVKPKYLNPVYPKGDALFFNMYRTLLKCNHLFVVEGLFKALRLWQIHEPAVAILGKEMTRGQAIRIASSAKKITLMLDPDALRFSIQGLEMIRIVGGHDNVGLMYPPKSPDDMSPEELKHFITEERRRRDAILSVSW